jgi:ABC-2 type transport system ATP-binding protein
MYVCWFLQIYNFKFAFPSNLRIMSISVKEVVKNYGNQRALDGVSFQINPGEVVGFLGPNGAGKSTMMKIISCYMPQTDGEVEVCGYNVLQDAMEVKRNVGYLPENNPLYQEMYIREYLSFVGGVYQIKRLRERITEMIEITGLGPEQGKKIGELSKGYRQRVGLAQALIHDPKVLILDEPTAGLDPNQLNEIRTLIKEIGKEKTVMLSTHIMQEVESVCDRVIIINKGLLVADSPVRELQKRKDHEQVITVEFDGILEKDLLLQIEGVKSAKQLNDTTYQVTSVAKTDIRPLVFQLAVEQNRSVLTLSQQDQSLEEVFKSLTNN